MERAKRALRVTGTHRDAIAYARQELRDYNDKDVDLVRSTPAPSVYGYAHTAADVLDVDIFSPVYCVDNARRYDDVVLLFVDTIEMCHMFAKIDAGEFTKHALDPVGTAIYLHRDPRTVFTPGASFTKTTHTAQAAMRSSYTRAVLSVLLLLLRPTGGRLAVVSREHDKDDLFTSTLRAFCQKTGIAFQAESPYPTNSDIRRWTITVGTAMLLPVTLAVGSIFLQSPAVVAAAAAHPQPTCVVVSDLITQSDTVPVCDVAYLPVNREIVTRMYVLTTAGHAQSLFRGVHLGAVLDGHKYIEKQIDVSNLSTDAVWVIEHLTHAQDEYLTGTDIVWPPGHDLAVAAPFAGTHMSIRRKDYADSERRLNLFPISDRGQDVLAAARICRYGVVSMCLAAICARTLCRKGYRAPTALEMLWADMRNTSAYMTRDGPVAVSVPTTRVANWTRLKLKSADDFYLWKDSHQSHTETREYVTTTYAQQQ
jgi:hypothetical protein